MRLKTMIRTLAVLLCLGVPGLVFAGFGGEDDGTQASHVTDNGGMDLGGGRFGYDYAVHNDGTTGFFFAFITFTQQASPPILFLTGGGYGYILRVSRAVPG